MRRVRVDEVDELRRVRLAMLLDTPDAFASRHADEAAQPYEFWQERAAIAAQSSQVATFHVVDSGRHVGSATGLRLDPARAADLVAMWVDPDGAGAGSGYAWARPVPLGGAPGQHLDRAGRAGAEHGRTDLYRRSGFEVIAGPHPAEAAPDLMELRMRRWLDLPPPGPVVKRLRRQGALVDQLESRRPDLHSLLLHVTRRRAAGHDPAAILQCDAAKPRWRRSRWTGARYSWPGFWRSTRARVRAVDALTGGPGRRQHGAGRDRSEPVTRNRPQRRGAGRPHHQPGPGGRPAAARRGGLGAVLLGGTSSAHAAVRRRLEPALRPVRVVSAGDGSPITASGWSPCTSTSPPTCV